MSASGDSMPSNPPPQTYSRLEFTKVGRPPAFRTKPRTLFIRSDGLVLCGPSLSGMPASDLVVKRVVPWSKVRHVEFRNSSQQILLRIYGEHDLLLTTDDPRVPQQFLHDLGSAAVDEGVNITASSRKNNTVLDLDSPEMAPILRLTPDDALRARTYSLSAKLRTRSRLLGIDGVDDAMPPITLAQWDHTFVASRHSAPVSALSSTLRTMLSKTHVVMHVRASLSLTSLESLPAPCQARAATDDPPVDPRWLAALASQSRRLYSGPLPSEKAVVERLWAFTLHGMLFLDPAGGKPLALPLYVFRHVFANPAENAAVLVLSSACDVPVPPLHIQLIDEAQFTTRKSEDVEEVLSCMKTLVERHGYELDVTKTNGSLSGVGNQSFGPPPAVSSPAAPVSPNEATDEAKSPPLSARRSVSFVEGRVEPTVAGASSPSIRSVATVAAPAVQQAADNGTPAPPERGGDLTERELRMLVQDFRAPYGRVCRKYFLPYTLLCRQCYRLTHRKAWEPRIFAINDTVGIVFIGMDGVVRRTIEFELITEIIVTEHHKGTAVALVIPTDHDCILRAHESTPKAYSMSDVAAVLAFVCPRAKVSTATGNGKEGFRTCISKGRNLKKANGYETPTQRLARLKASSPTGTPRGSSADMLRTSSTYTSALGSPREVEGVPMMEDSFTVVDDVPPNQEGNVSPRGATNGNSIPPTPRDVVPVGGTEQQSPAATLPPVEADRHDAKAEEASPRHRAERADGGGMHQYNSNGSGGGHSWGGDSDPHFANAPDSSPILHTSSNAAASPPSMPRHPQHHLDTTHDDDGAGEGEQPSSAIAPNAASASARPAGVPLIPNFDKVARADGNPSAPHHPKESVPVQSAEAVVPPGSLYTSSAATVVTPTSPRRHDASDSNNSRSRMTGLRVRSWPMPVALQQRDASLAATSFSGLSRSSSFAFVDQSDRDRHARLSEMRRSGVFEDPAVLPRSGSSSVVATMAGGGGNDAQSLPASAHAWRSCRVKIGESFATVYCHDDWLRLLQKERMAHGEVTAADGLFAAQPLFFVCAEGPAIYTFTYSYFLRALEVAEKYGWLRQGCILLREPSEDPLHVEWIHVDVDTFCRLSRGGVDLSEIALRCMRSLVDGLADEAAASMS